MLSAMVSGKRDLEVVLVPVVVPVVDVLVAVLARLSCPPAVASKPH